MPRGQRQRCVSCRIRAGTPWQARLKLTEGKAGQEGCRPSQALDRAVAPPRRRRHDHVPGEPCPHISAKRSHTDGVAATAARPGHRRLPLVAVQASARRRARAGGDRPGHREAGRGSESIPGASLLHTYTTQTHSTSLLSTPGSPTVRAIPLCAARETLTRLERDAMGADEYHPIGHKGSNLTDAGGIGYTVVDSLDTMLIMGLDDEYARARAWVDTRLSFDKDASFNTFEVSAPPRSAPDPLLIRPCHRADDDPRARRPPLGVPPHRRRALPRQGPGPRGPHPPRVRHALGAAAQQRQPRAARGRAERGQPAAREHRRGVDAPARVPVPRLPDGQRGVLGQGGEGESAGGLWLPAAGLMALKVMSTIKNARLASGLASIYMG
jgi:hypothetical protein